MARKTKRNTHGKSKKKMTKWNKFVKDFYHKKRRTNRNYSFKQALVDASRVYRRK